MTRFRSVAVLLAALLAIGALAASGSNDTATKVGGSGTSDTTKDENGNPIAQAFKVGDAVELGDWQVKVWKLTDPVVIPDDSFFKPDAGQRRVGIDVEVTNKGKDPTTVSSLLCFDLKDSENKTYDQAIFADSASGSIDGEIAPGASLRGEVFYDVPLTASGLVLNFKCDLFSSGSASIQLS